MNFHITRIRLSSVGPEPARYDPLELDLTNADGTGPADTVLFLPNTGGKTVLLRLLFSVLHPPIVEKIGSEEVTGRTKNLPGYVLDRDTSHIVIEWRRAEAGRFLDDEVLITGLVAEWKGGRATGKPTDLDRVWYTIRGSVQTVGADLLAFDMGVEGPDGVARRRLRSAQFCERLDELAKGDRRGGPEVVKTTVQHKWIEHLDSLGLDRALFRYQGEMNHNEAGASAIARFAEDVDFVEFFLKAVMDPAEIAVLDREFQEVADKARQYPEYERRLRFEEAARIELEPLAAEVAAARAARFEAESARTAARLLLAAFAGGESDARGREHTERERYRQRDADARKLAGTADRLRDEWREFRRVGAELSLGDAKRAYEEEKKRVAAADLDVRGWSLTHELARLHEARASVAALDLAYATEMKRIAPLRAARDAAGREYYRHLAADAVLATLAASEFKEGARVARERAGLSRTEERDALIEAAKLDAVREGHERVVGGVAARRAGLVAKRCLEAHERAADAFERESQRAGAARVRIDVLNAQVERLEGERGNLDDADRAAEPRTTELRGKVERLTSRVDAVNAERVALAENPLVRELAETDQFDLELVGPAIAERLLNRAAEADTARINLEVRGTDDRRALHGLAETGLLPPPADVEAALAKLALAGISGAMSGTRYIADAIAPLRRGAVASRRADLAGGIVLTDADDLPRARAVLAAASLEPAMIVAVGAAPDLVAAETATDELRTFVVPPTNAVWDRAAATAERERREGRMASLDAERGDVDARGKSARALAERLMSHVAAYPPGWLAARIAERDALAADLKRIDEEKAGRDARRTEIAFTIRNCRREAIDLATVAREAEQRAGELKRLADDESATADLPAAIDRLRVEAGDWRVAADEAAKAAGNADGEALRAQQAATDHEAAAERIRSDLSRISLSESVPDPTPAEAAELSHGGTDRADVRARFVELDRRLKGETSTSEVAARRDAAIRTRDDLQRAVVLQPSEVRARAEVLLALPESSEAAGRRAAAERADSEVTSARIAEREAFAVQDGAQRDLTAIDEEIKKSRRSVKLPQERTPRDRHHAARMAAEALQKAETTQAQVGEAEREREAARVAADTAKTLADALAGLVTPLRMGLNLAADAPLPAVEAFLGDADAARQQGLATSRRLTDAAAAEDAAEKALRVRDSAVRALLARPDFADLAPSDRLYRRLAQSTAEALARDAEDLVAELRASVAILRAEITTMSEDMKLATVSLAKCVNKAISYLRLAETRSKMPASLRDWAGEPFLLIRFEKPPAEELEARLATFVSAVVYQTKDRPMGNKLLLQAIGRAVGQFSIKILKPNEGFALIRVPVTELSSPTFSNGQRSTVATALMLMFSELRRQSRGAGRDASVGTLLLDNPFGNANAGFLIEVQRTVAAAAGIQLVYTTGIVDLNALRRFPRVIALSNDSARRTMKRYVRANQALLELLVPPDSGPGGRVTAASVIAIPSQEPVRGH